MQKDAFCSKEENYVALDFLVDREFQADMAGEKDRLFCQIFVKSGKVQVTVLCKNQVIVHYASPCLELVGHTSFKRVQC